MTDAEPSQFSANVSAGDERDRAGSAAFWPTVRRGRGGRVRVLVIDDDRELAEAIGVGLRREQMAVDLSFDGDAGLERALVYGYDVIVLDRTCPGCMATRCAPIW